MDDRRDLTSLFRLAVTAPKERPPAAGRLAGPRRIPALTLPLLTCLANGACASGEVDDMPFPTSLSSAMPMAGASTGATTGASDSDAAEGSEGSASAADASSSDSSASDPVPPGDPGTTSLPDPGTSGPGPSDPGSSETYGSGAYGSTYGPGTHGSDTYGPGTYGSDTYGPGTYGPDTYDSWTSDSDPYDACYPPDFPCYDDDECCGQSCSYDGYCE